MSEPTDERPETAPAAEGVLETWRATPRPVRALLLGTFVNKLGGFLQVFLVLFLTHRGFAPLQACLALSLYGAGSVFGVLVGGWVSDRIGARLTIAGSMAATAALLLTVVYVSGFPAVVVVVTLVGAVSQFYRPASATLIAELTPSGRQVMVFAMSRLALNLGTTAAPLLGAAIVAWSYDLLFWGEAIAAALFAMLALVALAPAPAVAATVSETSAAAGPERARSGGYLLVLRDRRFIAYLLAMFVNAAVYMQYLSTLPLTVRGAGLDAVWYSVLVSVNGAVVITSELAMTKRVGRWPGRRVLGVGFTLLGAGLALYSVPGGPALLVAGTLIWSLAEIIEGPTMFAYPAQAASDAVRGRYVAAAHAVFGVGMAVAPVVGVAAYEALGASAWLLFGLASLLALVPGLYGLRPELARPDLPRPSGRGSAVRMVRRWRSTALVGAGQVPSDPAG